MSFRNVGRVSLSIALILLVAACGAAATPAPPSATPVPTSLVQSPAGPQSTGSTGQQLFVSKGCAACHGQGGEGTGIAPGLAGHAPNQTKRQIRAPLGSMPVFPPDKISNQELEEIAEYVASLGGGHGHGQSMNAGDAVAQHHWMALIALEDEDQAEAVHRINHLLELVTGEHRVRMQEALNETEAGQFHDGAHIVEEMLAGLDPFDLTEGDMHLRQIMSAARVGDSAEAIHQMEHFLELAEPGSPLARQGTDILEMMRAGELAEAQHHMSELMGIEKDLHDESEEHQDEGGPHRETPGHRGDDRHR